MANHCPKCNNPVDTQANFNCPKCGETFWQNKESFLKRELKESFKLVNEPKVELSISFWWRLLISPRFSEYFLKGFISGLITVVLVVVLASLKSSKDWMLQALGLIMATYWIAITIGYIYGFVKFRKLPRRATREQRPEGTKKLEKIFCPKCGKKVDDDSSYCIFCGSKITPIRHHRNHST